MRKLTAEDAGDLFQYFSNDEVTKYYDLDRFDSLRQAEELIQNWNIRYLERRGFRWAITVKSEGDRVIGTCGFHNWSQEHYKAEIGYENGSGILATGRDERGAAGNFALWL